LEDGGTWMSDQHEGKRFRQILGNKIRKLRTMSGKTQIELAKELGFTSSGAISQVENGLRGLTVESIMKAAKALSVHPIVLLMPDDLNKNDIEKISAMFKLFEKRSERPDLISRLIEEIQKILDFSNLPLKARTKAGTSDYKNLFI
jgi:transcriptional regulator with XRE-family HTH domain